MSPNSESELSDEALLGKVTEEFTDAPDLANPAAELLREHFGTSDLSTLGVASDTYLAMVDVHLQNALEQFVEKPGRESSLHGLALPLSFSQQMVPITQLVSPPTLT